MKNQGKGPGFLCILKRRNVYKSTKYNLKNKKINNLAFYSKYKKYSVYVFTFEKIYAIFVA